MTNPYDAHDIAAVSAKVRWLLDKIYLKNIW